MNHALPHEYACSTRRDFLTSMASGIGGLALTSLLGEEARSASSDQRAPLQPHHAPRAKHCIFFFMAGGSSQLELFDPKPRLNELSGQRAPPSFDSGERFAFVQADTSTIMGSPFRFARHGASGMELSELLPNLARHADRLCLVRSMHTEPFNHHPSQTMMHTGFPRMGRPSAGAWLTYGLGSPARDLPGYVVLEPEVNTRAGPDLWSSAFLPSNTGGVRFDLASNEVVHGLARAPGLSPEADRAALESLTRLDRLHAARVHDPEIEARISSYELAFRMQAAAPALLDLSDESRSTLDAYGVDREEAAGRFGRSCLLARRMVERGVRFVHVIFADWDHHTGIVDGLKKNCRIVDQPIGALLEDLQRRGLLDETLVVWSTEFGRTSLCDNRAGRDEISGRDHQPSAFSTWLAGGGARGGHVHGETDELGWHVVRDPVHVNDFHATLLHLFGFDHERLTYHFEGRDHRLTDVAGRVVGELLAPI